MLDEGKVQGDGDGGGSSSQKRLDRRVAKFFALACAQGVAKGCVNYGVMQVRACMRQVRREACASSMARRALRRPMHAFSSVAPGTLLLGPRPPSVLEICCLYPPEAFYGAGCMQQKVCLAKLASPSKHASPASLLPWLPNPPNAVTHSLRPTLYCMSSV